MTQLFRAGQAFVYLVAAEGDSKPAHAKTCVCGTEILSTSLSVTRPIYQAAAALLTAAYRV